MALAGPLTGRQALMRRQHLFSALVVVCSAGPMYAVLQLQYGPTWCACVVANIITDVVLCQLNVASAYSRLLHA